MFISRKLTYRISASTVVIGWQKQICIVQLEVLLESREMLQPVFLFNFGFNVRQITSRLIDILQISSDFHSKLTAIFFN